MLLKTLNSKQRDALEYYLEKNDIELYDGIEDSIYNEEEANQYIINVLKEEREYFIEKLKESNISSECFIYLNIKTEEDFITYCTENEVYLEYIGYLFDEICDNIYYMYK